MKPDGSNHTRSRRWFLQLGAAWSAALAACTSRSSGTAPPSEPRALGAPVSPYGSRSKFEKTARYFNQNTKVPLEEASSRTPLHDTYGMITPSSLHFERHHSGVPEIDPAQHTLTIHGLVDRPLVLTVDELRRLPSVSRIHFLECSGNSGSEWRGGSGDSDVQRIHGLTSCSEWTGVPVATLLRECGVQKDATWVLAEGADASKHDRSIPIRKMMDDAMVAYGQNGEPLRPEQGYPMRLFLPGWEGNANVKWLRRLKVMNQPVMSREETSKYTDLMADGSARQFTFDMEPKSLITRPSGGDKLTGAGPYELTGIAWTGRGTIVSVEITTDGGSTWTRADLQTPVLPRAHTRFRQMWKWDGREALLASRCTDDTGYTQPSIAELVKVRGVNSNYHNNGIQAWKVASDGTITNGNSASLL
jgi:sulfane dehydrogenase subunit SoxC